MTRLSEVAARSRLNINTVPQSFRLIRKVSLNSTDPVLKVDNKYRRFTPREVARIQSFPETFKLTESEHAQYKALGNAIPPVMFWYIMRSVKDSLNSEKKYESITV